MENKKSISVNPIKWVPSVYFAMGMPFVVLSLVSVIMFADLGVDKAKITFWTSLLLLPYSLKPIWSPLLELYSTKKIFVVTTQLISGICFGLIAFLLPVSNFFAFTIALMCVIAFSGATHDIATDGIYLSALDKQTQAKYIGWQGAFYNLAKVLANGGLVAAAGLLIRHFEQTSPANAAVYAWMIIIGVIGLMLVVLSIYHYFVLPNVKENRGKDLDFSSSMKSMFEIFKKFFTKKHIWFYILFIICYRLTEGFAVKMVPLFLKDSTSLGGLGMSNTEIGLIYGTLGTIAFIIGSILGGYYIAHFGLKKVLFSLVCIFNIPFVVYFILAWIQPDWISVVQDYDSINKIVEISIHYNYFYIASGLILEYFCYGFGFVGLTLFMMQEVAAGEHSMAHYAFASGIMNLGFMIPGMLSGYICNVVGYKMFFLIALIVSIPSFLLTWFIPFNSESKSK